MPPAFKGGEISRKCQLSLGSVYYCRGIYYAKYYGVGGGRLGKKIRGKQIKRGERRKLKMHLFWLYTPQNCGTALAGDDRK